MLIFWITKIISAYGRFGRRLRSRARRLGQRWPALPPQWTASRDVLSSPDDKDDHLHPYPCVQFAYQRYSGIIALPENRVATVQLGSPAFSIKNCEPFVPGPALA